MLAQVLVPGQGRPGLSAFAFSLKAAADGGVVQGGNAADGIWEGRYRSYTAATRLPQLEETVVQINGTGPFDVMYLDPNDDPRKK